MQVRKSFFNDLNIDSNVSIVDLLYQQFYTGSEKEPSEAERDFMLRLFRSEIYVKSEYRYQLITKERGLSYDDIEHRVANWTAYLLKYREYIEKGYQLTRLAVQEPYGVMVLQVTTATTADYYGFKVSWEL